MGDINAHSSLWDKQANQDTRGDAVENWLAINDMSCLNDGTPTRYSKSVDSISTPDVSLVSSSLIDKCAWRVIDALGSDHKPILITLEDEINTPKVNNTTKYKWKLTKADWQGFTNLLEDQIPNNAKKKSFNKIEKLLRKSTTKAAEKHLGTKKVSNITKPWLTDEIKDEIKRRNQLSKTIRTNREEWVESCQKVAAMIKEEKTRIWKQYIEGLEQTTSDVEVWRTIRSLDGRQPPAKKNEALVVKGKAYISDADKAEQFAKTYKSFSRIPVGKNDRKLRRYVIKP